ncbi:MAG: TonB-dependent receptor [Flavobacteriaceae bacterium]|nr:TonB-dependent receptor [Flavobacteriaceae bacterium]
MKKIILLIGFLFFWVYFYGQEPTTNKITVTGKIIDSISKKTVEFATISFKNNEGIVGTTSDKKGNFSMSIPSGIYTIKIEFLSYTPKEFINRELKQDTNLGNVQLLFSAENLDEVEVVAREKLIEFKVNKKIYNASKDIVNRGGNAMDVLNNTPSVRVDEDGNVIMRGASATVLIDGKPLFGLDSNTDILSTIPSNSIEKVEIITRSAKYSADGGGAILNIVTKKRKGSGLSGSIDLHLGTPDNNGASTFLNENTDNINIFSTISFNNEKKIRRTTIDQTIFDNNDNVTGFYDEIRKDENQRNSFLFSLGSDFYINNNNTLTTSLLINTNNKNFISTLGLDDFDATNTLERSANRNVGDFDDDSRIELFLNYTTKFNDDGHQLSFDFKYDNTVSKNNATIIESTIIPISESINQKVDKEQNLDNFLFQLDYTLPFSDTKKLESGYKGTFRLYENDFKVSQFDEILRDFITIGGFNDVVNYDEKIHAFYMQYSASHGNLSYSLGLRSETTDISIGEDSSNNIISKNYTNLFPSATLDYEFEGGSYLSLYYSRGINRPSIAQINPFISLSSERFQSIGNPDLDSYFNDYVEFSFGKDFEKLSIISSVFLNYAKDPFLTVIQNAGQNADGSDIFIRTPINNGNKNIIGVDIDLTYRPFKGLRFGTYINPYNLDISNTIDNLYNFNSWVLYAQTYALVSLNNGLRFKVDHGYQSSIKNKLTTLKAINFANITISKSLFKKKATLTFRVKDVFNSKWFSTQSFEANTNTLRRTRYDQRFNLSFTYRFKQKRRSSRDRGREVNKDVLEDKQDEKL